MGIQSNTWAAFPNYGSTESRVIEMPQDLHSGQSNNGTRNNTSNNTSNNNEDERNEKKLNDKEEFLKKFNKTQSLKLPLALFMGLNLGRFAFKSGINTFIHEYLGHVQLGGQMVFEYPNHLPPFVYGKNIQLDGYEILVSQLSVIDKLKKLFMGVDFNHDFKLGWANANYGALGPSVVNEEMCLAGNVSDPSAWLALSGSLAPLITSSLMIILGQKNFFKYPAISIMMISAALTTHFYNSLYPASVINADHFMMNFYLRSGHDFARFDTMLGLNPETVTNIYTFSLLGLSFFHFLSVWANEKAHPLISAGQLVRPLWPIIKGFRKNNLYFATKLDQTLTYTLAPLSFAETYKSAKSIYDKHLENNKKEKIDRAQVLLALEFMGHFLKSLILTSMTYDYYNEPEFHSIYDLAGSWKMPATLCLSGFTSTCRFLRKGLEGQKNNE